MRTHNRVVGENADAGVADKLLPSTSRRGQLESLPVQPGCVPVCPSWPAATVRIDIVAGKPRIADQAVTEMYIDLFDLGVVTLSLKDVG